MRTSTMAGLLARYISMQKQRLFTTVGNHRIRGKCIHNDDIRKIIILKNPKLNFSSISVASFSGNNTPSSAMSDAYSDQATRVAQSPLPTKENTVIEGNTEYEKLVKRLYMTNLFNPVKLGLDNIEKLHEVLGNPINSEIAVIHIAGTNGKGSVAYKIAKALELSGHKTGLFVSPHVSSFRERISINGIPISEEDVEHFLPRVFDAAEEHSIPSTFFEVTTALAYLYFGEKKVDVVVLETGLGGRLDATNIFSDPLLTVITSIGLEHTQFLGDTVEKIALEKGGIIKKGRPVLVGPNVPHKVLADCASQKGASAYHTCSDILKDDGMKVEEMLADIPKDFDLENSRIALAGLTIIQKQLEQESNSSRRMQSISMWCAKDGVYHRPPCRFEIVEIAVDHDSLPQIVDSSSTQNTVQVVLDVAHNEPAMQSLISKLNKTFPSTPKRFVVGFSSDKDIAPTIQIILSNTSPNQIHLAQSLNTRAAHIESVLNVIPNLSSECNYNLQDRSITTQVLDALKIAAKENEVVVICGSVFVMAEAREALGFEEARDSKVIAEVAGSNYRFGQENFGDLKKN